MELTETTTPEELDSNAIAEKISPWISKLYQRQYIDYRKNPSTFIRGRAFQKEGNLGEYIPLYMLDFRDFSHSSVDARYYSSFPHNLNRSTKNEINKIFTKDGIDPGVGDVYQHKLIPFFKNLSDNINKLSPKSNRELSIFLEIYENKIIEYVNKIGYSYLECAKGVAKPEYSTNGDYNSLFNCQRQLNFNSHPLRSGNYIGGFGSLFDEKGNPIWTMCVHKKHVDYIKLCFILNKEIDQSVYTLFIQEGFDTKNTTNKPLRSAYRKHMKKNVESNGIPIIEADLIKLFAAEVILPGNAMSISGKRAFEKQTFQEFVGYFNATQELADSGIELTV